MPEEEQNIISVDAVEAKHFNLVDKDGETRFSLGTTSDGDAVAANFFDAQGLARIVLAVQESGNATVSLTDENQQERVRVSAGAMGNTITLYDREQRTRVLVQMDPEADGGEIHLVDESGTPQILITQVGRDQAAPSPLIGIRDQSETFREI